MNAPIDPQHNLLNLLEKQNVSTPFLEEYLSMTQPVNTSGAMFPFLSQCNKLLNAAIAHKLGDVNRVKSELEACQLLKDSLQMQVLKYHMAVKQESATAPSGLTHYRECSLQPTFRIEAAIIQAYCYVKLHRGSDYKVSMSLLRQTEKDLNKLKTEQREVPEHLESKFLIVGSFVYMRAPNSLPGEWKNREPYFENANRYLDRLDEIINSPQADPQHSEEDEQYKLFYLLWKGELLVRRRRDQTDETLEQGYDLTRQALDLHDSKQLKTPDGWILSRASKNLCNFIRQIKVGYLEPIINRAIECCDRQLKLESSGSLIRMNKIRLLWEKRIRILEENQDSELLEDFSKCPAHSSKQKDYDEDMERLRHARNHFNKKETIPNLQTLMIEARDIARSIMRDTEQRPFPDAINNYIRSKYAAEPNCTAADICDEAEDYMKNMSRNSDKGLVYRILGMLFLSDHDKENAKAMFQRGSQYGDSLCETMLNHLQK